MINHTALHTTTQHQIPACSDFMMMAEQELTAYFAAVRELFGSEQARLSAEDWLHELEVIDDLPASNREWRQLTTNAAARLAGRLNISSAALV